MLPIYHAIAQAGFYVFLHAQVVFFVFLALAILVLWILKPWRMKTTAATVILTPLIVLYATILLAALIPPLREQGLVPYPAWLNLTVIFTLLVFVPAGFYHLLSRLDKERKAATDHPMIDKVLDYVGTAFFLGFVLLTGFGSFSRPLASGGGFSWHAVTMICLFTAGFAIFLRFVLGAVVLAASADNPYLQVVKRFYPALIYLLLGSSFLALVSYGLEGL